MGINEQIEEGIKLNVQRKEVINRCPKCGMQLDRFKRWKLINRADGQIIFRKVVRPVAHILLNKFTCSNCGWQGKALDVLKSKNLTMFGTRKMRKTLQRYPFELFAKAKPHDKRLDRH